MPNLIRRAEVLQRCAISNSTLYRLIDTEEFPAPVQVSRRGVAWVEHEVDEWITNRICERHEARQSGEDVQ
ncbi:MULTISPECIES: AlpA family transcriptional regulator [Halomonadaceae]|uniref:helix-turn-helix transcriptional regulator n=1 Tax=Halomonadaceae TaxID=28256 RepID=UPI001598CFB4|nr:MULTISPECIES: AlpA family phage regulatory protein [Halomonas]QJQ95431.1 AlpA family phage regulatory protein [Halomonas sp. PA5]